MQLRQFVAGRGHYWAALAGVLTPEQEYALDPSGAAPFREQPIVRSEPASLSATDEKLLAALAEDGRASLVDLAATAGLAPGRVARRMQALLTAGVLYFDVEITPSALGYRARANLLLRVHPGQLKAVGRALARMPEVAFAAAVSGPHNLHAVVHCRDLDELFEFSTERVGALPGVEALEISPALRQVNRSAPGSRATAWWRVRPDPVTGPPPGSSIMSGVLGGRVAMAGVAAAMVAGVAACGTGVVDSDRLTADFAAEVRIDGFRRPATVGEQGVREVYFVGRAKDPVARLRVPGYAPGLQPLPPEGAVVLPSSGGVPSSPAGSRSSPPRITRTHAAGPGVRKTGAAVLATPVRPSRSTSSRPSPAGSPGASPDASAGAGLQPGANAWAGEMLIDARDLPYRNAWCSIELVRLDPTVFVAPQPLESMGVMPSELERLAAGKLDVVRATMRCVLPPGVEAGPTATPSGSVGPSELVAPPPSESVPPSSAPASPRPPRTPR